MSSAKWRPFCLGLNLLRLWGWSIIVPSFFSICSLLGLAAMNSRHFAPTNTTNLDMGTYELDQIHSNHVIFLQSQKALHCSPPGWCIVVWYSVLYKFHTCKLCHKQDHVIIDSYPQVSPVWYTDRTTSIAWLLALPGHQQVINYVGLTDPCLPYRRILTTAVLRNDRKYNYIFMFPKINSAVLIIKIIDVPPWDFPSATEGAGAG